MDRWDIIIIGVAAYIALITLVRLMARRHQDMSSQVRSQITAELSRNKRKRKKKAEEDHPTQDDLGAA